MQNMTEYPIIVSPAVTADIPQLERLVNEAYRGPVSKEGWTTEADLLTGVRITEAGLAEMLGKKNAMILKASAENGKLAGCVYLEKQDDDLYLGLITVSPQIQARGIGKKILRAAEAQATRLQCHRVTMGVISIRHELIAWYERRGYQKTGVTRPLPVDKKFVVSKEPFVLMEMAKTVDSRPQKAAGN